MPEPDRSGPLGSLELPERPDDEATLDPDTHPVGQFIAILLFALFWNGIVSVFATMAVRSLVKGKPDWFLLIFIVPFVLIGLMVLVAAVHGFLGLFNPRPAITVSRGAVPLGATVDVRWQLSRPSQRLRDLTIRLDCVEWIEYRRGTDTTTEEHVVLSLPVATVDRPGFSGTGSAEVTVPADAMHSFRGARNQIIWKLHVTGEIPRWPDIELDFELPIIPADHAWRLREGAS